MTKSNAQKISSTGRVMSFFFIALLFTLGISSTKAFAGTSIAQANATIATIQADQATQQQNYQNALNSGNTAAETTASDQLAVDAANISAQQALIALDNASGGSAAAIAAAQNQVNTTDAALQAAIAKAATDAGNTTTAAQATAAGQTDTNAVQTFQAGNTFVPLTNIPAITTFTSAQNLTTLFNNLYKICIGVAATLAVLQIIRAGFMYMGGDSVTETKQARALIATAIGGLVLVLSPVILFSIINPKILNLQVGVSGLTPAIAQTGAATGAANPAPAATTAATNQYQVVAGTYLYVEEVTIPGSSCLTIQATNATSQSACQSQVQANITPWNSANVQANTTPTILYNCAAPAGGAVSVPSANLCSTQPYLIGI